MSKITTLLVGVMFTALIAGQGFAATAEPAAPHEPKPSTTSGPSPAPEATVAPTPAPVSPATAPAAVTAATVPTGGQPMKIGYVDMGKIASESATGKAATASMKAKSEKLKARIQAKEKQLEKEKAAIESKLETLSPKERAAKAKQFQKKVEDYQKLVRSSEEDMQEMQEKLTKEIYNTIKKTAASYAKSHGYAIIADEKAVLFASDAYEPKDLTEEITAAVNQRQKK